MALALHFRHRAQVRLRETEARARSDAELLHELTVENQHLSNRLADAAKDAAPNRASELANVRQTAAALKDRTNELAQKLQKSRGSLSVEPEPFHPQRLPEYFQQVHQMAGNKPRDATRLAAAFLSYGAEHGDQAPSSLDQLTQALGPGEEVPSGTNHFEIVYHGSLQDIQGIPRGAVAVLRDRESWIGPEGKPLRVYGMGDGTGVIVGADESIETWEAKHILAPKPNSAAR